MTKTPFLAVIFDMDGVITKTAKVHARAWETMFNDFLNYREAQHGEPYRPFDPTAEYLHHIDGKPRFAGVEQFLCKRGIDLPYGQEDALPGMDTVCGLGNLKSEIFNKMLLDGGIKLHESTIKLIHKLKQEGVRVGVASSSKNCKAILEKAGIANLFETRMDGLELARLGLRGKPAPDIFRQACDNLGVPYDKAVVIEDTVAGVRAGALGGFGLTLGISRRDNLKALRCNGADVVVSDINDIGFKGLVRWFDENLETENWSLNYSDYDLEKERLRETLMTTGNGYFATRGALTEVQSNKINYPGTYVAGLFNRLESDVADKTLTNEDFVNSINWLPVTFKIGEGDFFDPNHAKILYIERKINFRNGLLSSHMVVSDKNRNETMIETERIVSMHNKHQMGLRYSITPLNYAGNITVQALLDGDLVNAGVPRYDALNQQHLKPVDQGIEGDCFFVEVKTCTSGIKQAVAAKLKLGEKNHELLPQTQGTSLPGVAMVEFVHQAKKGKTIVVEKLCALFTDMDDEHPLQRAKDEVASIPGFEELLASSAGAWDTLWDKFDVRIEGDRLSQRILRMHTYHLLVTASHHRVGIDYGIPPRGLHGEAYRGHIFWDELYILPLYDMHMPQVTKACLLYRYRRMQEAMASAKASGYKGTMFPWQSGSSGAEETQQWHLNPISGKWGPDQSLRQRHVSLAIAYNIGRYVHTTNDVDFLRDYGIRMLFEICRFWSSMAKYNLKTNRYEICGVMGPDEFHELHPNCPDGGLKDNAYTNIMVVWVMRKTMALLQLLDEDTKDELLEDYDVFELKDWTDISQNINLPKHKDGIMAQFDGYEELKELDWQAYRKKYGQIGRMDRILKAEGLSPDDYKVSKQADFMMIFYCMAPQEFDDILMELGYTLPDDFLSRHFHYYEQRTSHGSTLSKVVFSYVASLIGEHDTSWEFFTQALVSDLEDTQGGTTQEGIHAGVMAGTVLLALYNYAGLNLKGEIPEIRPNLPKHWRGIKFSASFRGIEFKLEVEKNVVRVQAAQAMEIKIGEEVYLVNPRRKALKVLI